MKTRSSRRKARENAYNQSFGFACDWLRRWREFFKPIILLSLPVLRPKPKLSLYLANHKAHRKSGEPIKTHAAHKKARENLFS